MNRLSMALCVLLVAACGTNDKDKENTKTPTEEVWCFPPEMSCGGTCIDPLTDPAHCGACGKSCGKGGRCVAAKCAGGSENNNNNNANNTNSVTECKEPHTPCNGACVDTATNARHCGACGKSCGDDLCVDGTCQAAGGDCREGNTCPKGHYCDLGDGRCLPGCAIDDHCGGNPCNPATHSCCRSSETICSGSCVNTGSDPDHCGDCGYTCEAPANAKAVCNDSGCDFECDGDAERCYDTCIDTTSDPNNCGSCGYECTYPEGGSVLCTTGKCVPTCPYGKTHCELTSWPYGECVDTKTDPNNCGGCGNKCPSTSGTPTCVNGKCDVTCSGSQTNCNGVCVYLDSDEDNCGSCGKVCKPPGGDGYAYCDYGKCTQKCNSGYGVCNGECCYLSWSSCCHFNGVTECHLKEYCN